MIKTDPEAKLSIQNPRITPTQQKFIDNYDGNVRRTAKRIGITPDYGYQLLSLPRYAHIQEALKKRAFGEYGNLRKYVIAPREERQAFWTKVMRGEVKDHVVIQTKEGPKVLEVPTPLKLKLKASELLGKSEGDFVQKHVVGFDQGIVNDLLGYFPPEKAKIIKAKLIEKAQIIDGGTPRRIEG